MNPYLENVLDRLASLDQYACRIVKKFRDAMQKATDEAEDLFGRINTLAEQAQDELARAKQEGSV